MSSTKNFKALSANDVEVMLTKKSFFDNIWNPEGKGITHQYKEQTINDDKVIFDEVTGLMWQQGGSPKEMPFEQAKKLWADELNYAGFHDWRLPTLEEAMSLMEPEKKNGNLHIDPVFDARQEWIWTADLFKGQPWAWVVDFYVGRCGCRFYRSYFVRAVRSR